jgi:hypothetical protein
VFPISATFQMTDEVATRAAREAWVGLGRRLFTLPMIGLVAFSAMMFVLARRGEPHPVWLALTAAGPALFGLLALTWALGLWWAPRAMRRKLAHLPHRHVEMEFTESEFAVQTATEQVRLQWIEVTAMRQFPNFCFLCLRGGAEIPVPLDALPTEALSAIRNKVASHQLMTLK